MKAFSLEGEVQNLIDELRRLKLSNAFTVLEWFYKTIDYNSMFEDKNISNYVFSALTEAGYQPMQDPVSDLANFKKLMNSGASASEIEVANGLISQILYAIENSQSLDTMLISLIQTFNERFNKQFAYGLMMENLKECIGDRILYTGMRNKQYFIQRGILTYVSDFKFFTVNGEELEFFGDDTTILTIESSTGKTLFRNDASKEEPRPEKNVMQFS